MKHLLHQQNRFLDRPGARIGSEILMLFLHRAPVVGHPRKAGARIRRRTRAGHLQVRIAFVIPKQNVVLGVERLDQVVFQQQGLGLRAHHRCFQPHDLAHHVADTRAAVIFLKIARHPLFQIDRLAHVEHSALGVEIAVHARQGRQPRHVAEQLRRARGQGCGCRACGRFR